MIDPWKLIRGANKDVQEAIDRLVAEREVLRRFWDAFHSREQSVCNWNAEDIDRATTDRLRSADAEVRRLLGEPNIDTRVAFIDPDHPDDPPSQYRDYCGELRWRETGDLVDGSPDPD